MIAEAAGFQNSYRIPLGRRLKSERKIGFHGAARRIMATAYREKLEAGDDADSPANSFKLRGMIGAPQEKHMITIAPTGGGEFRSVLVPELLTYPGPIVCLDIKGEAYAVTARRRRELGQRVVRLDPLHVIGPSTDSLNFFDLFSLPNADLETDAQMIASMISDSSSLTKDPFWDLSARGLVSGCIVYLAQHRDKAEQPNGTVSSR